MSTSVAVHRVKRVVTQRQESSGTKWTTLTIFDNNDEEVLTLTLFTDDFIAYTDLEDDND